MHSGGGNRRSCGSVSRFGHPRINARLPASRGLSQAAASFVASRCQDIHRTPLRAWPRLPRRRPPLGRTPPHPENTPGGQRQERPRQGVAGADDACRAHPPPGSSPSRGTRSDANATGRPVMGQLSPKKVLDDARPTESTNLEPPGRGNGRYTPRGGDHPGCRGGRRGSGRATPSLARRAIAGRSARKCASRPSSLNLVFNCQRATFISGLRRLTNYPAECG